MSVLTCKTPNCPNYNCNENFHNDDFSINDNNNINGNSSKNQGWRYSFSRSPALNNEPCTECKKSKKLERQRKTRSQILISKGLISKTTSILVNTAANSDGLGQIDKNDNAFTSYQDFVTKFDMGMYGNKRTSSSITNNNRDHKVNNNTKANKRISIAEFDGRVYMINNNNIDENVAENINDDEGDGSKEFEKHSNYCECGGSGVGCQCSVKCYC
jgi:hypothetical protein